MWINGLKDHDFMWILAGQDVTWKNKARHVDQFYPYNTIHHLACILVGQFLYDALQGQGHCLSTRIPASKSRTEQRGSKCINHKGGNHFLCFFGSMSENY